MSEGDTAYPGRSAAYDVSIDNIWDDPTENDQQIKWTRSFYETLTPFLTDAMYLNFTAGDGNRELLVGSQHGRFWAKAEILDGEDYDRTWAALTADREYYRDYQTRCERPIPLVRLHELRPA